MSGTASEENFHGDGTVRRGPAQGPSADDLQPSLQVHFVLSPPRGGADRPGARRTYSSARPPWGLAYGARCGYGSQYMPAHGRTLRRRISRFPNQACDWPTRPALVASRHRRVRSAASTVARRVYAYDFLSPDMLRNEWGASFNPANSVWFRIFDAAPRRVDAAYAGDDRSVRDLPDTDSFSDNFPVAH